MTTLVNTQQKLLGFTETQVSQLQMMILLFRILKLRLDSS